LDSYKGLKDLIFWMIENNVYDWTGFLGALDKEPGAYNKE
jgi:hypothetical protein